jgi:HK97 family phage portal protein
MNDSRDKLSLAKKLTQAISYSLSGGWFTPEMPLDPQHPETAGRRYDYMAGFNISTKPRRDSGIDFEQLRNLATYYDILRIIIDKRKDQISNFEWSIVPEDAKTGQKIDPKTQAKIDMVRKFMEKPDGRLSWSRWLRMVIEDFLVLDAVALWPVYKGNTCTAVEVVDPATIKLIIDASGRKPDPPYPAYQQILHGVPASNYTRDELLYFISNPASNRLYGWSKVEQIVVTIQIGLRRELSQLQYFTDGNIPDAIAGVPDNWTPTQIGQLQQAFDAMLAGNTAERRKLKFVPGDASKIMMMRSEDANLKTEFDEWLVRVICFNFGVNPSPFLNQVNRATAQSAQEEAHEEGLGPSLAYIKNLVDTIIHKALRVEGVEFKWTMQSDIDAATQATIDDTYIKAGVYSIDEVRQRMGLEALGIDNMIFTGSGPVPVQMYVDGTAPSLQPPQPPDPLGFGGGKPPPKQLGFDAAKRPPNKNEGDQKAKSKNPNSKEVSAGSAKPFRGTGKQVPKRIGTGKVNKTWY